MALADAYIAFWDPNIIINAGDHIQLFMQPQQMAMIKQKPNQNWEPLLPTPPVPGLSFRTFYFGKCCGNGIDLFFWKHSPFSTTSTTAFPAGAVRSFKSFKQAADENADSRVMVGIHFRFACEAGQKMGDKVGKWTLDNYLKPLH